MILIRLAAIARLLYGLGIAWTTVGLLEDSWSFSLVGAAMLGAGASLGWRNRQ